MCSSRSKTAGCSSSCRGSTGRSSAPPIPTTSASTTATTLLPGARPRPGEGPGAAAPDEALAELWPVYGTRAADVLALAGDDPALRAPLCPHHRGVTAEIAHAVNVEWAQTLGDVLLRRTTLGLTACQGLDCIDDVAARMGGLLGWDAGRQKAEVERYQAEIEPMRRFSTREP